MVTVVYRVIVKKGKENNFKEIAFVCTKSARKSNNCLKYTFFQAIDNPREFLVHYKFKNIDDQKIHIENLRKLLGSSPKGRDLPAKFIDLLEAEEVVLFDQK